MCALAYIVWTSVDVAQFLGISVSHTGNIEVENVVKTRPQDGKQVPRIAAEANKS